MAAATCGVRRSVEPHRARRPGRGRRQAALHICRHTSQRRSPRGSVGRPSGAPISFAGGIAHRFPFLRGPALSGLVDRPCPGMLGSWPRPDRQQRASGGRCRNRPPGKRPGASAADHRDQGLPARINLAGYRARVFGVPTCRLGDELFWGDDRLPHLAARLAGAIPEPLEKIERLLERPRGVERRGQLGETPGPVR